MPTSSGDLRAAAGASGGGGAEGRRGPRRPWGCALASHLLSWRQFLLGGDGGHSPVLLLPLRAGVPLPRPLFARLSEGVPGSSVSSWPPVLRREETPKVCLHCLITKSKSFFPRECFSLKEADLAFFGGFVGLNTDVQYVRHSLPGGPCGSEAEPHCLRHSAETAGGLHSGRGPRPPLPPAAPRLARTPRRQARAAGSVHPIFPNS